MLTGFATVSRRHCAVLMAGAAVVACGCQTYEAKPLDLGADRAAFLARLPDTPDVREFAARLAGTGEASAAAFDPADGFSVREAELVALVLNAELRVARLRAGVTAAGAENAGLWDDPTIGVDVTRILQSTPNPWKLAATVGFTLPISGRLEVERERAGSEHGAELARVFEQEWRTRMDLRRAWTHWSSLVARMRSTGEFLSDVEQVVAVVDLMERAGELSRTEARLFRVERAAAAAELELLETQRDVSVMVIKRLMGLSPRAEVALEPSPLGASIDRTEGRFAAMEREDWWMTVERPGNPALLVATAEYEVAERTLELEIRRQYPDLHIGPGYGREDGQDQVLLGLSLPVPVLNGNRRGIAEARAAREVALAHVRSVQERLLSELAEAGAQWRSAGAQRRRLEEHIAPLVDAQYADARELARLGEVNTLVLLESLKRAHETKLRLIDAGRDEALAMIQLDEVMGPAPGSVGPAGERRSGELP